MNKHDQVETYRVVFRPGNWVTLSERYYTVHHSSEALQDIHDVFHAGHVHARKIKIHRIEEWNRYTNKWEDRTDKAFEHSVDLINTFLDGKKIIIRRVANTKK